MHPLAFSSSAICYPTQWMTVEVIIKTRLRTTQPSHQIQGKGQQSLSLSSRFFCNCNCWQFTQAQSSFSTELTYHRWANLQLYQIPALVPGVTRFVNLSGLSFSFSLSFSLVTRGSGQRRVTILNRESRWRTQRSWAKFTFWNSVEV